MVDNYRNEFTVADQVLDGMICFFQPKKLFIEILILCSLFQVGPVDSHNYHISETRLFQIDENSKQSGKKLIF